MQIKELQTIFSWSEEDAKQEIREIKSLTATLFDLVRHYIKILSELKYKKNILSFSDVEALTVKLLDASRDYWTRNGVIDWGIVINETDEER